MSIVARSSTRFPEASFKRSRNRLHAAECGRGSTRAGRVARIRKWHANTGKRLFRHVCETRFCAPSAAGETRLVC
ncbi:MAG: hypothetical protein ACKPJJ_17520, partial [Planctomycetaceae bacterium]